MAEYAAGGDPLRAAAFGDSPGARVPGLLAAGPATPRRRWLAAVVLGGQGRYAAATALLRPLSVGGDPVFASLACSTLASHRRQLGAHAVARRFDGAALGALAGVPNGAGDPDGIDVPGAHLDAVLGLAADAVGLGRITETRRLLAVADGFADVGWRGTVRRHWVTAEAALGAGRAADAIAAAESAVSIARASNAQRHVTKSEVVLATALHVSATESGRVKARTLLADVVRLSLDSGMLPLAWPSALLLADLTRVEAQEMRECAHRTLRCILRRSDAESRDAAGRSPWMPATDGAAPDR